MRTMRFLPLLLLLACAQAHARPSTSVPPVNQPLVGPTAALERFADAYRDRSPDSVLANLTLDYHFHTRGNNLAFFAMGSDRDKEAGTIRGMLHGVIRGGDTLMAPADSVGIIIDGISDGVDPEHPDSSTHYRVLSVRRFELRVRTTRGQYFEIASPLNVFHVVRGDVALLPADQPVDTLRWYVRRWLEDVTEVNADLGQRAGDCGEEPAPRPGPHSAAASAPAVPTVLAVRPLTNPACAKLEVRLDLPGREPLRLEVYDVGGRRVNLREIPVDAAGTFTIEAGHGAKLTPGVYWVRARQGVRPAATQMVVVAR